MSDSVSFVTIRVCYFSVCLVICRGGYGQPGSFGGDMYGGAAGGYGYGIILLSSSILLSLFECHIMDRLTVLKIFQAGSCTLNIFQLTCTTCFF